jgi:hypothetical protein
MAALLVMAGALSACAVSRYADPAPERVPTPETTATYGDAEAGPGAFIIRYADSELRLAPTNWRLGSESSENIKDTPPPIVGADELYVFSPVAGWFIYFDQYTGRSPLTCDGIAFVPEVEDLGDGWSVIRPGGPDGTYSLKILAASGPGGGPNGEMTGLIMWNVSNGTPLPPPSATISILRDDEGTLDAWDVTVSVANLEPPTENVSALVTVTSVEGRSIIFRPEPTGGCTHGYLSLTLGLNDVEAQEVIALGSAPYTYAVDLVIEGATFVGTAQYTEGPNDVSLKFATPLP